MSYLRGCMHFLFKDIYIWCRYMLEKAYNLITATLLIIDLFYVMVHSY